MKQAIVVGSGAGGATSAKELQGRYNVIVLEAGREFHPFSMNLSFIEQVKKTGLMRDEREIQILFPAMKIRKTGDRMVMVNGIGLGGTTTLATGNAVRVDRDLREIGIHLDEEYGELAREIPIHTEHRTRWRPETKRLFEICSEMNLHPEPLPKMGDPRKCIHCGRCVFGCPTGAKWDSRRFLRSAIEKGASVRTGCRVKNVVIRDGKAIGVNIRKGFRSEFLAADLVILAAGGFGTPAVLEASGVSCDEKLFVDPVLCVAARREKALQNREISMPFVVQRNGFILSPYFDYLSFFFNPAWRYPARDTLGIMIKLADTNSGTVSGGTIKKKLSDRDKEGLREGVQVCRELFQRLGVDAEQTILGTVNAGHPGGMLPLTGDEAVTFHSRRLPDNLYVSDATLFPNSLGNPPILTIMAMAKRIGKICSQL